MHRIRRKNKLTMVAQISAVAIVRFRTSHARRSPTLAIFILSLLRAMPNNFQCQLTNIIIFTYLCDENLLLFLASLYQPI